MAQFLSSTRSASIIAESLFFGRTNTRSVNLILEEQEVEMEDSSSQSFFRRHWEGYKEFWSERFSILDNYAPFVMRDEQLPSWSASDVEEFMASDPVHGPTLKTAREAVSFGLTGSAIGAVSTAGFAWKYSKSLHGAGLSFVAGGVFGWTFGHEIANHWFQLYRLDTMAAQVKFMEWWQHKSEPRA